MIDVVMYKTYAENYIKIHKISQEEIFRGDEALNDIIIV